MTGADLAPSVRADNFVWDGKDAYGRLINGRQQAKVTLSYVYPTVYRSPAEFQTSFGALGGSRLMANATRTEISASQEWRVPVGGGAGCTGWLPGSTTSGPVWFDEG